MESLDLLRFLLGAGFLAYASVLDWRTRRVPNGVWLGLGACAACLALVDAFVTGRFDVWSWAVAAGIAALAYGLWWIHVIPGGADAKALMALAVLLPEPIAWDWAGWTGPGWVSPIPGALVVLANAALVVTLAPFGLLVVNGLRGHLSFPAMLLGYRMPLDAAASAYVWIVDRIRDDGTRHQVLFPSRTSPEAYDENVARLRARGVSSVWVTPKVPFMVPLAVGFGLAFLLGDVLYQGVERLVRALVLGA